MPEPTDQIRPLVTCHCGTAIAGYLPDDAANLLARHQCPKPVDRAGYVAVVVLVAIVFAAIVTFKIA